MASATAQHELRNMPALLPMDRQMRAYLRARA
jgi:hypothetical protein